MSDVAQSPCTGEGTPYARSSAVAYCQAYDELPLKSMTNERRRVRERARRLVLRHLAGWRSVAPSPRAIPPEPSQQRGLLHLAPQAVERDVGCCAVRLDGQATQWCHPRRRRTAQHGTE